MAMEVLLRRNIDGVGRVGEIVKVRGGFARNFLIPKGWAALVTPDAMRHIHKDKQAEAVREAEEASYRSELAEQLEDLTLTLEARAGEDGHLYGSVGARQVRDALADLGYPFDIRQVRFEAVRELGEYEAPIALTRDHVVSVKVWVVQDAREAADLAAEQALAAEQGLLEAEPTEGAEATPES